MGPNASVGECEANEMAKIQQRQESATSYTIPIKIYSDKLVLVKRTSNKNPNEINDTKIMLCGQGDERVPLSVRSRAHCLKMCARVRRQYGSVEV